MCKILVIPNVSALSKKRLKTFIRAVLPDMTKIDRDGFGYAYQGETGVYSEKFLDPALVRPMRPEFVVPDFLSAQSESQGVPTEPIGGLIVHSRTSTNVESLAATHPFRQGNLTMIHNGVCQNVGEPVPYPSGNDSEMVFQHYLLGGMARVEKSVSGYYAVGILDEKRRQTIIFKDGTARLFSIYVRKLGSLAFATTPEILDSVAKFFKEECRIMKVKDNVHLTFNASGVLLSQSTFTPIRQTFGALDRKSLGFSASYQDDDWGLPSRDRELEFCDGFGRPISRETYAKLSKEEQAECTLWDDDKPVSIIA